MTTIDTNEPFSSQEFPLLYEVLTALHAIRDLDDLLDQILAHIQRVFEIEGVSIALHDAAKHSFYFIRTIEDSRKDRRQPAKRIDFPDNVGVAGWVLRERKAVVIPDVAQDGRFYSGVDEAEAFKTRSMICVPLQSQKGLIGVLYAINKLKGTFSAKEGRLLELLSGTIAIAIDNARLYGELKQYANALEQENRRLLSEVHQRFNLQGVIGSSAAMRQVFALMEKVIGTDTSVLVQGETGTGKELIARVIHYNGPRKNKPFVAENCGALTESLLESELFGHVKGAFTGAISNKKGLFELANGGTIFLDEIGETTPALQVRLLRVLQEGQIRRVGGERPIKIDVRVIASTNRDLEAEARKGAFRQDLFYRISVFPLTLPPLLQRKEDIPLLAAHFIEKFSAKLGKGRRRLSPSVLQMLTAFDWPGNVREFENEIERALTLAGDEKEITLAHLSAKITGNAPAAALIPQPGGTLKEVVQQIEHRMIKDALDREAGNRTRTARRLGLTRQGLLNKMKRYDLE